LLGAAIVGALYGRRTARACCGGFFVFCAGYLFVALAWHPETELTHYQLNSVFWSVPSRADEPRLLTTRLLDWLHEMTIPPMGLTSGSLVLVQWGSPGSFFEASILEVKASQFKIRYSDDKSGGYDEWVGASRMRPVGYSWSVREAFRVLGHYLLAPWFGLAGAVLALEVARRSTREQRSAPGPVTPST
jgi:hypothetical protein